MTDFEPSRALLRRVRVACLLAALGGVAVNAHAQCGDWEPVGTGITHTSPSWDTAVYALAAFDDGTGPVLYAGGRFTRAGGLVVSHLARWNGTAWSSGGGVGEFSPAVYALEVLDHGTGPALYAGGQFEILGGVSARNIARRTASTGWAPLGDGIGSYREQEEVRAFASLGAWLYAGGHFDERFGNPGNNIARWSGSAWSRLGWGVGGNFDSTFALEVFNDGSGPALYVGHSSWPSDFIERWDGASWWPVGTGVSGGSVFALKVFDDGTGPALYAGGEFSEAGGNPASGIARWDGTAWTPLGTGVGGGQFAEVYALEVFDDGTGPALYAGGVFTEAGGNPASNIARWDGAAWSPLGAGVSGGQWTPIVFAMTVFDDGTGPALYAGGRFEAAGGSPASNIARWVPRPPCRADLNSDCVIDADDFFLYLDLFADSDPIADINGDGVIDADDFFEYLVLFAAGC
ncbi:MAG: hypothetical protein JJU33_14960 [Phycisphaerales bacterium]|nr:hypothetical protein [Phycisphaerales bacterium]